MKMMIGCTGTETYPKLPILLYILAVLTGFSFCLNTSPSIADEFSFVDIQPLLEGYQNNAIIEAKGTDVQIEVLARTENEEQRLGIKEGAKLVRTLRGGSSITYGPKGVIITGVGMELLVASGKEAENGEWFLRKLGFDKSIYVLIGKVPIAGYIFDSNPKNPLKFELRSGRGFIYLSGIGRVLKNEKVIKDFPLRQADAGAKVFVQSSATPANPLPKQLVIEAQMKLDDIGYNPGIPDGIWGKKSVEALQSYQKDQGMDPTGQLDKASIEKLGLKTPAQLGTTDAKKQTGVVKQFALEGITYSSILCIRTDVVISQPNGPGTQLSISGSMESTGLACLGARHKFKGRVEMEGHGFEKYIFEGNEVDPLTFVCNTNGYTYAGGKGRVRKKADGSVVFDTK